MLKLNIVKTLSMEISEHQLSRKGKKSVVIAGGGTGGHIYPGIAIAKAIQSRDPEVEVHFVGAKGGLEEKIVPKEGFPLHLVPIGKLHSSVGKWQQFKTLLGLPFAFLKSIFLLFKLRPQALLGVGGFASGPILFVGSLFKFRTFVWEPNAVPGLANRLLSRFVDQCLVVFKDASKHLKSTNIVQSGLPVRPSMKPSSRPKTNERSPLRILVFGGSQGAHAINDVLCRLLISKPDWLNKVEIVHQTGTRDFQEIQDAYKVLPGNVEVFEYLHDMDKRFKWADLIICRAGASTVAEICACQKAAVFIPLPTAADNHQQKNAEVLVQGNAADMILQKNLSEVLLEETILKYVNRPQLVTELEGRVEEFHFPDAADRISSRLLGETNE